MDFSKIFDAYSNSESASERTQEINNAPELPGNISYALRESFAVENDIEQSDEPAIEPQTKNSEELDLDQSILDSLSGLDEPVYTEEQTDNEPVQDFSIENDSPNMSLDDMIVSPEEIENEFDLEGWDENDIIEGSQENTPELLKKEEDNTTISLFDESDALANNFDDISLNINEEVQFDEIPSTFNEFDIESPDELYNDYQQEETVTDLEDSGELNNFQDIDTELPDFNETESEITEEIPETNENFDFENQENQARFDLWKDDNSLLDISSIRLDEERIFSIREKINTIQDKDLRFELRNIILEPQFHKEYFDELVSLLLTDAEETKIKQFLDKHLERLDNESIPLSSISETSRSTFFADDVESFEHFKEDFSKAVKKIVLIAVIFITFGIASWTFIAQPVRVENLYKKGLLAVQETRFTEGESLFNQAQQTAGKPSLKWNLKFASVYAAKNMIQLAEIKYKNALIIEPKNIAAAKQAADFYTNLTPPDFSAAINIFNKLSSIYPNNFEVWDYYGGLYMAKAEAIRNDQAIQTEIYYQAADIYKNFILNNLKNIAPYYRMIDIYIKTDNIQKVKEIYNIVEQLHPKFLNLDVLTKLLAYYIDRRELADAEKIFRLVIPFVDRNIQKMPAFQKSLQQHYNIPPNKVSNILSDTYYEFARYNILSSDIPKATKLLTNSIKLNVKNAKSYNLLGEAVLITPSIPDRLTQAKNLFDQALSIEPLSYRPHINLGHLYFYWDKESGNSSQSLNTALFHYRTAKALMPVKVKDFLLNYNLGWLEYYNKNFQDTLTLWSDIYKEEPGNPTLSYALGSVLYQVNNPRLSQVEFQKAANTYQNLMQNILVPELNNKRHVEIYTQYAKARNNLGVINVNYAKANQARALFFEKEALLNFYAAKDAADRINIIYNYVEYNILVLSHQNIRNRTVEFDNEIPKNTTLNNKNSEFKSFLLQEI
ncbi:hypothetical protein SAMN02745150_00192 [Brevinema andersonii]|uniref:Tetratricopeptide repeat-containing protein n=1 Tax=Brevinema andersonii TaxID=34097 RepID=A0A1I1D715_BREAD|nr:hypothetical protein [Brevinema andersonii]SFB68590.1 hypothetical protein SAMN02745150_00192 [Brevinema andersonii]